MRGKFKRVKYIFTTFCKFFSRIKVCHVYIIYSQLRVIFFLLETLLGIYNFRRSVSMGEWRI